MITEKELIHAAKVFRENCQMNQDKISFADSCKVVLLSKLVDSGRSFTNGELELLWLALQRNRAWYRFW